MKATTLLLGIALICFGTACSPKIQTNKDQALKGRFEIAGLCNNYTFTVIEGKLDSSKVQAQWTNPQTGKSYASAFGIKNPCDLPKDIKEGDEFYFELVADSSKNCMTCMAYFPSPEKKLSIRVLEIEKK